jgi:hypothetical protein
MREAENEGLLRTLARGVRRATSLPRSGLMSQPSQRRPISCAIRPGATKRIEDPFPRLSEVIDNVADAADSDTKST